MRIGIDVRPLQTFSSRNRGIGRYIHNQVLALLEVASQETIFLFYDPCLDLPVLFEVAPAAPHWSTVPFYDPLKIEVEQLPIDANRDFLQSSALQVDIFNYRLDVFHITSVFEYDIAIGQNLDLCPMVATLYDLIPLVFASDYLWTTVDEFREIYLHRLDLLRRADRLMSISDASRRDAVDLLGISAEKIDVILGGVDGSFTRLTDSTLIETVRTKFNLPDQYILSILDFHYTKNLEGAIAAYSHLPMSLRARTPFAIVCKLTDRERREIDNIVQNYGVQDQVILTGFVSQSELVALLNGATIFFYPSRYDGFGLPVLEAMRCGTPVITSNMSSLPEIVGETALLVSPDNIQEMSETLVKLLTNSKLRETFRKKGFTQVEKFSWHRVAGKTLDVYRKAVRTKLLPHVDDVPQRQKKIAFWTPLNPCKSGISDYSESLLPHLSKYMDIDIYVDGYHPTNDSIVDQFAIYDALVYPTLTARYDINLYQIGNSSFHEYMYNTLLNYPGVVVLHDYMLHGLVFNMTGAKGQYEEYLAEIAYNEGNDTRNDVATRLAKGKLNTYKYPLNKRVLEASLGVIVHSQWAKEELTQQGFAKPMVVIPHGVNLLSSNYKLRQDIRLKLKASSDTLIVGCFGRIATTKRIDVVIRAFARLHTVYPNSILLVVGGGNRDLVHTLNEQVRSRNLMGSVIFTGFATDEVFETYLQATDICVNLRYPSAGETSGSLCRALGAGLPVLASNLSQFAELPDNCVWKVDVNEYEENELTAYLIELAFNANLRREMSQNARNYIAQKATWPKVTKQYAKFLHYIISLNHNDAQR